MDGLDLFMMKSRRVNITLEQEYKYVVMSVQQNPQLLLSQYSGDPGLCSCSRPFEIVEGRHTG